MLGNHCRHICLRQGRPLSMCRVRRAPVYAVVLVLAQAVLLALGAKKVQPPSLITPSLIAEDKYGRQSPSRRPCGCQGCYALGRDQENSGCDLLSWRADSVAEKLMQKPLDGQHLAVRLLPLLHGPNHP
jgi:hypothetical protein